MAEIDAHSKPPLGPPPDPRFVEFLECQQRCTIDGGVVDVGGDSMLLAYEMIGGDSLDAMNMVVHWYIEQATARAKANGRKTVRAHDFLAM